MNRPDKLLLSAFKLLLCMAVMVFSRPTNSPEQLDDLLQEALQNNPQLKAAQLQASAAQSRIGQATAWDAPEVGLEFYQTPIQSFPNPLREQMETDYFIQQMFPFPGKLSAMGRAAENSANMEEQNYGALQRKIIQELKTAFFELYFIQHAISINEENQQLLRSFIDIAARQYQVGMGNQADVLRAQTELSRLQNEAIGLSQKLRRIEAMLNAILSRPADAPFDSLGEVEAAALFSPVIASDFSQISAIALDARPELKAMGYNIDMYRAELAAARREYYPDLMGRLMYKDMAETGDDFWSAMVGVNIPLAFWSKAKYTNKVGENELLVQKAQADFANMKNMVLSNVQQALVSVQTNKNSVDLLKTSIIPQAEQTLKSTLAVYQTGKTEFLMLIDAYRMVLMAKLDYHMAVMNFMISRAELEQAVGLSFGEIEARIQ